jgi:hypothetical protein
MGVVPLIAEFYEVLLRLRSPTTVLKGREDVLPTT